MKRGFGSPNYDRTRAREAQRAGMKALTESGKVHRWTVGDEARKAGEKGAQVATAKRRAA